MEFVTTLLLLYVLVFFFGSKACEILAYPTRDQTCTPALEGEVLATGPPGEASIQLLKQE